jgi:hypothetical protein
MALTACLVWFISTVNGRSNKKRKEDYPWKAGTSSGHITNLKQSILETFDIYERDRLVILNVNKT